MSDNTRNTAGGNANLKEGRLLAPSRAADGGVAAGGRVANQIRPGQFDTPDASAKKGKDGASPVALSYERQVEAESEEAGTIAEYSSTSSFKFFCKHSYRDVGRRRCHFCLSFCSVLIVVWSALVINTLVEKGPVIFLKLAEGDEGQYDGLIYPTRDFDGMATYTNKDGIFVNYSRVDTVVGGKYNLAPRKQFCKSTVWAKGDKDRRARYDDQYYEQLRAEEEATYRPTSDGRTRLPSSRDAYRATGPRVRACTMFLDTEREREIDLGRRYQFEPLGEGECIIHEQLADSLQVEKGDVIYMQIDMYQNLAALVDQYNAQAAPGKRVDRSRVKAYGGSASVGAPCRVAHVGNQSYGKIPKEQAADQIYMEYKTIYKYISDKLPTELRQPEFETFLKTQGERLAYELADFLMMTLPAPRVAYYQSSNYFDIQRGVTSYANEVIDALGFFPVRMQMPVLKQMQVFSSAILILGLIFDIIILLFIILSVLLIYSLLMISVESKTFEFGVMRMVGLSKRGIISMIILQSFMFVLPSVAFGFALSMPALSVLYTFLFTADMGVDTNPWPSQFAVVQALVVGLVIPLLSSIAPIQSALSKNLNESLDLQRSKTQAIYIEILDTEKTNMGSYIVFGVVAVTYGLSIYYFLPLAMLSFNFALVLQIFFMILVGMLFGLSLLAFNLQRFLEIILCYVLLFWEQSSMRQMVLKNLTAHKMRNKMTSIIYSIALGFVIFLVVSYTLQIKSTQLQELREQGTFFKVSSDLYHIKPELFDPLLQKHADNIEAFAYQAATLNYDPTSGIRDAKCSDNARINQLKVNVEGGQPQLFDALLDDFLDVAWQSSSGLSLGEQLYSARGSQSAAVGAYVTDFTSTNPAHYNESILLQLYSQAPTDPNKYYRKRPLWTAKQAPAYTMRDRAPGQYGRNTFLLSLPAYSRLRDPWRSVKQIRWAGLVVKFKDPGSEAYKANVKRFILDCKSRLSGPHANSIEFFDYFDDTETTEVVQLILDIIFNVIIVITMVLCLFSLASSMSANLLEQTKEIGILRAMGFTKARIKVLYFYEAFILVMASCLLGVMIGTIVGFTMVLQQVVFTSIPLFFYFPWTQFLVIMAMSLLCAFVSTWGPTRQLVKNDIAHIFRMGS